MAEAEEWAAGISGPAYAIDDQTAIAVVDGAVEVVSEGHWKLLSRLCRIVDPQSVERHVVKVCPSLEIGGCPRLSHIATEPKRQAASEENDRSLSGGSRRA